MKTDVIWRMKQRTALRRCVQLTLAGVPPSERIPGAYKAVAARFAGDMSRFRDEWTSFDFSFTPLVWREGRIAIRYRFLSPNRIVEVLSVELEDKPQVKLNQSSDPTLSSGTPPAAQKARPS